MVNRTRINSAQSIFFWNITRHQAISPVAKFHHVLGRGFMIRSTGDIDFYQMSLGQSESTILHESIILYVIISQKSFSYIKLLSINELFNFLPRK